MRPLPLLGLVAGASVGADTIGQLGGDRGESSDAARVALVAAVALLAALASLSPRLAAAVTAAFVGWAAGAGLAAAQGSGHGLEVLAGGMAGAMTGMAIAVLLSPGRCLPVIGTALASAKVLVVGSVLLWTGRLSIDGLLDLAPVGNHAALSALTVVTLAGVLVQLVLARPHPLPARRFERHLVARTGAPRPGMDGVEDHRTVLSDPARRALDDTDGEDADGSRTGARRHRVLPYRRDVIGPE